MKNWQQIAEEMTAIKDGVLAMKAETRRMGEELGICPACHGAGCILEPEESFSFSEFDPCAKCKCSGKVEVRI